MPSPIKNVTLEMSPKPYKVMDDADILATTRELFRQWDALTRHADMISVMLWTADGSEILEYRGDLSEQFDWARYSAMMNPFTHKVHPAYPTEEENMALHAGISLYMEKPPVMTYGVLKKIVETIKKVGAEMTGKPIRVGATFDPGDEFAISPFKYEKHPEICLGNTRGKATFVTCYSVLNADSASYAGFPNGIPQGTPFGTFFGRQCQHFLGDLGFDYIWLSNGFGFGAETWGTTGVLFDGTTFDPSRAKEVGKLTLDFWRYFRKECPEFTIEVRGTNLSIGVDLASDGVPWRDIYDGKFKMLPPPNSPWAAIDGDFGLELAGYLSRIAEIPGDKEYPFRFYLHDPWWQNSPWIDRYESQPHDIYIPMSVARIDAHGNVETPAHIQFLTVDNTWGEIPVKFPNEVTPYILNAKDDEPDAPGPVVWAYPFDEYHTLTFGDKPRLDEVFFGDWFMRGAINTGFPVNTVVSTRNLVSALAARPGLFGGSVLLATVPQAGSAAERALLDFVRGGGQVLLYGPTDHAGSEMLTALNLKHGAAIAGEMDITVNLAQDKLTHGAFKKRINHRVTMCGGGISEQLSNAADKATKVTATVAQAGESRVAALIRADKAWQGGRLAWVRGTNSNSYKKGERLLEPDDPKVYFRGELLMRWMLAELGQDVKMTKRDATLRDPVTCIARNRNAFVFSGYVPNTTVQLRFHFAQGAPLMTGYEIELVGGYSTYYVPTRLASRMPRLRRAERGCAACLRRDLPHGAQGHQATAAGEGHDRRHGALLPGTGQRADRLPAHARRQDGDVAVQHAPAFQARRGRQRAVHLPGAFHGRSDVCLVVSPGRVWNPATTKSMWRCQREPS